MGPVAVMVGVEAEVGVEVKVEVEVGVGISRMEKLTLSIFISESFLELFSFTIIRVCDKVELLSKVPVNVHVIQLVELVGQLPSL